MTASEARALMPRYKDPIAFDVYMKANVYPWIEGAALLDTNGINIQVRKEWGSRIVERLNSQGYIAHVNMTGELSIQWGGGLGK